MFKGINSIDELIKYASDKHKVFVGKLWDGTKVYLINGGWVRDNMDAEFIGGGHDHQDKRIPDGEIWVERVEDPIDQKEILTHEIVEWMLMKYKKLEYDKAHEIANSIEDTIRRIPDAIGEKAPKKTYQEDKLI